MIRFHLSESEDDHTSLERIHTFNLKSDANRSHSSMSNNEKKLPKKKSKIKSLRQLLNQKVLMKENQKISQDGSIQMPTLSTVE